MKRRTFKKLRSKPQSDHHRCEWFRSPDRCGRPGRRTGRGNGLERCCQCHQTADQRVKRDCRRSRISSGLKRQSSSGSPEQSSRAGFVIGKAFLRRQAGHADVHARFPRITLWVLGTDFSEFAHGGIELHDVNAAAARRWCLKQPTTQGWPPSPTRPISIPTPQPIAKLGQI